MGTRTITMSHEELDRFGVISRVRERRLTQVEAARILDLGVRQDQRLCAAVVRDGADGLISRKRGRPSSRRFPESFRRSYGKPVAFYSDKHAVFRVNKSGATHGEGMTQFGRALHDLNIESICANSAPAKGRVERANNTLQDRLVKELRLAGVNTMAAGNTFLDVFTWQESRAVTHQLTIQYDRVIYLITPGPETNPVAGKHVTVSRHRELQASRLGAHAGTRGSTRE
jgi:hypothetical protein